MAHAYTPGLRVTAQTVLRKERRLPLEGEVLVNVGDRVARDQIVARTELPGDVVTQNLVNRLGVTAAELPSYMLKQAGDTVAAGDPIAETRPWIKWFKTVVEAKIDGMIENVSAVTGQVLLRKPPSKVEIAAFVDGVVTDELPGEGVIIETEGTYVQGIFGVGNERWGTLRMLSQQPDETLRPEQIDEHCCDCVLVAGGLAPLESLHKAVNMGAAGVIAGGIHDRDLKELLGYDLGVAITGAEAIGTTIIISEGFGKIAMARRTFDILHSCNGKQASISGATQIRAGVQRPEVIIARENNTSPAATTTNPVGGGLKEGDTLRAIRAPYFGRVARVRALIPELQVVESGAAVRVLKVEFEDGTQAIVPRANVELIEE